MVTPQELKMVNQNLESNKINGEKNVFCLRAQKKFFYF